MRCENSTILGKHPTFCFLKRCSDGAMVGSYCSSCLGEGGATHLGEETEAMLNLQWDMPCDSRRARPQTGFGEHTVRLPWGLRG